MSKIKIKNSRPNNSIGKKPVDLSGIKLLLRLNKTINKWEDSKNTDSALFLKHPAKAIWANIVVGISRGVGFVLGVSIVGAFVVTLLGWFLNHFISIPIIGKYIAVIVEQVQEYINNKPNGM